MTPPTDQIDSDVAAILGEVGWPSAGLSASQRPRNAFIAIGVALSIALYPSSPPPSQPVRRTSAETSPQDAHPLADMLTSAPPDQNVGAASGSATAPTLPSAQSGAANRPTQANQLAAQGLVSSLAMRGRRKGPPGKGRRDVRRSVTWASELAERKAYARPEELGQVDRSSTPGSSGNNHAKALEAERLEAIDAIRLLRQR